MACAVPVAVFYAVGGDLSLTFLSEENTEHGRNLLDRPQVAGTIHDDSQDWRAGPRWLQAAREGADRHGR